MLATPRYPVPCLEASGFAFQTCPGDLTGAAHTREMNELGYPYAGYEPEHIGPKFLNFVERVGRASGWEKRDAGPSLAPTRFDRCSVHGRYGERYHKFHLQARLDSRLGASTGVFTLLVLDM
jgi:hypothetical protein